MWRMGMNNTVRFQMRVPVAVRQEGNWFYSSCPPLDVHSQGLSRLEAINNLIEALQLFVTTCFELGTLEQVLHDMGLEAGGIQQEDPSDGDMIDVPLPLLARRHAENRAH